MFKKIMVSSLVSFLFVGCASQTSISPDGKRYVSVEKTYFNGGQISSEFLRTSKNTKTGILRRYGYDGKVTSNTDIVNGVKQGYERLYDSNGRLLKKTPYNSGFIHGTEYIYYPGGQIMVATPYHSGKKEGKAFVYNLDGSINKTAVFRKGKRIR